MSIFQSALRLFIVNLQDHITKYIIVRDDPFRLLKPTPTRQDYKMLIHSHIKIFKNWNVACIWLDQASHFNLKSTKVRFFCKHFIILATNNTSCVSFSHTSMPNKAATKNYATTNSVLQANHRHSTYHCYASHLLVDNDNTIVYQTSPWKQLCSG